MAKNFTIQQILDLPMDDNDSGANTIGGYLQQLLITLFEEGEGFSGKRPFGNSGWEYDLYVPLIKAGAVSGKLDEDGYVQQVNGRQAEALIKKVLFSMRLVGDK